MARGKREYTRLAKPMGYVDLEKNEFDNFLKKLKRKKRRSKNRIGKSQTCEQKAAARRFSSAEAKQKFLNKCRGVSEEIKATGGVTPKPVQKPVIKSGVEQKKSIANKVFEASQKQKNKSQVADEVKATTEEEVINAPEVPTKAEPNKAAANKMLLYGAIGVVVLIVGLKYIK